MCYRICRGVGGNYNNVKNVLSTVIQSSSDKSAPITAKDVSIE